MRWIHVTAIFAILSDEIIFTVAYFGVLPLFGIHLPLSLYVGIIAVLVGKDLIVVKLIWNVVIRPPQMGKETLIGKVGTAYTDIDPHGTVKIENELWKAETTNPVKRGEKVVVRSMNGLFLHVEPINNEGNEGTRK